MLVEPEPLPELLLALIEAEMLSLKLALVETDSLALIEVEVLSLNDTLTDLLSETDSLALTDSRYLGRLNSGLDSLVGSPLL